MRTDGYVLVSELLETPTTKSKTNISFLINAELKVTLEEIKQVVDNNDKKRY